MGKPTTWKSFAINDGSAHHADLSPHSAKLAYISDTTSSTKPPNMPPTTQSPPVIPELHLPPPILLAPNPFGNMSRRTRRDSLTEIRQRPIIVTHPARDGWHERQEDLIKVHRELIAQYEELREKIRAANIRLGLEGLSGGRSQGDRNVRAHEAPEA